MRISVVINTLNRAKFLGTTLKALAYQTFKDFEVIVVNGPSTDNTKEVLQPYMSTIVYGEVDEANLSISRNKGIALSSGDVVAFIDDDGVPEPQWLEKLAGAYERPRVGAVGGFLLDHTGVAFQARYIVCDRLGRAEFFNENRTKSYNLSKFWRFNTTIGCNSSFRRKALCDVGGFDEEYEYFLDETDVCARLIDYGYEIEIIPSARVHHKYAPSHIRGENKVVKYFYPIVKNIIYFSLQNRKISPLFESKVDQYILDIESAFLRGDNTFMFDRRKLTKSAFEDSNLEIFKGINDGKKRGLGDRRLRYFSDIENEFRAFPVYKNVNHRVIIISQDYPPKKNGGIGTFSFDFACALASKGYDIHVITKGVLESVDFESGVWVHRLSSKTTMNFNIDSNILKIKNLPSDIGSWALQVAVYINELSEHKKVDVVYSPIWDIEGAYVKDICPGVKHYVWLQTNYATAIATHSEWKKEPFYSHHYLPVLAAEKIVLETADGIHSISEAIKSEVFNFHQIDLTQKTIVLPIGVPDVTNKESLFEITGLSVLFVGRLEKRKGVDILLLSCVMLWDNGLDFKLTLVGRDDILFDGLDCNIKQWFLKNYRRHLDKVFFAGVLSEDDLLAEYAKCDLLVVPSTFESFGLTAIEAMRFGKPVVATRVGGLAEIVKDGECGVLCSDKDLSLAISKLINDREMRVKMGRCARSHYLTNYEIGVVTDRISNFLFSKV